MLSVHQRGAYFTPAKVAEALCRWAVRRGDRVLDPACGDGVFLRAARSRGARAAGFELDPDSAKAAGAACGDFFEQERTTYDAVVGNPPYVHFTQENRQRHARAMAERMGVKFGAGASTWGPFLVAAADAVRPGGRLAMVIPRETLFVDYAHPLIAHLKQKFERVEIVCVRSFLFEGALEKVAVLLCGPALRSATQGREAGFRIREVGTPDELTADYLDDETAGEESLAWSRVPRSCRDLARRALDRLVPLTDLADVNIGIVTGDKGYFLVQDDALPSLPVVASPNWVRGAVVTERDLAGRPRLLDVAADYAGGDRAVDAYLAEGRRRGVHLRYKCAERACWWRPRIAARPDAFLGYLSDHLPRLVLNRARAHGTNNLHRVTFKEPVAVGAFYNPATLLSIELGGRVLGDSALKLEPGDAEKVRVARVRRDPLREVDVALRAGDVTLAVRIAGDATGLPPRELAACARAHSTMVDLRIRERRMKA